MTTRSKLPPDADLRHEIMGGMDPGFLLDDGVLSDTLMPLLERSRGIVFAAAKALRHEDGDGELNHEEVSRALTQVYEQLRMAMAAVRYSEHRELQAAKRAKGDLASTAEATS